MANWSKIITLLDEKKWSLATAESCTGGMIAAQIVGEAGASKVFKGSIVSYCNEIKTKLLQVDEEVLHLHGAVSEQCVLQMLEGCRVALDCECAIAVSGVAGPDGGTPEKPVGLVYIGVVTPEKILIERCHYHGDRTAIRVQSSDTAAEILEEILNLRR